MTGLSKVVHSSVKTGGRDEWRTRHNVFDYYNYQLGFTLDAAADATNHLCSRWLGPGGLYEDALAVDWNFLAGMVEFVWLNPPYSLTAEFMAHAEKQARLGYAHTTALIAARTDTRCFHDVIFRYAKSITFIKGRLTFDDPNTILVPGKKPGPAPFPSMIVEFSPTHEEEYAPTILTVTNKELMTYQGKVPTF